MIRLTVDFLKKFKEQHGPFQSVFEVGSRDVTQDMGSARDVFKESPSYVGIDLQIGKDVTRVLNSHDIKQHFEPNSFDLVICCDTLEHDKKFWITVENMQWLTKNGGWMVISVPGGACGLHEWPDDYWRFMRSGVRDFFEGWEEVHIETWDIKATLAGMAAEPQDLLGEIMAWGRKPL